MRTMSSQQRVRLLRLHALYGQWHMTAEHRSRCDVSCLRRTHNAQRDMHSHCLRTYGHRHQFLGALIRLHCEHVSSVCITMATGQ